MSERVHSYITADEYEQLCDALEYLVNHTGVLCWTIGHTGEYLNPSKNFPHLEKAIENIGAIKYTLQGREQEAQEGDE